MTDDKLNDLARRLVNHGLLICRQIVPNTVDALRPGYEASKCQSCGRNVQISPDGQNQIKEHGPMVVACNKCGTLLAATAATTEGGVEVVEGPYARQQRERRERK